MNKLNYALTRSNRKTTALYVRDGALEVRAPFRMSKAEIDRFVQGKQDWAERMLAKSADLAEQKGVFTVDYGSRVTYRGKEYIVGGVLYGPNASGKPNVIGAMDTFKNIVLRGNIRNSVERNSPNTAAYNLELIPNNAATEQSPVAFSITFIEGSVLVEYAFAADIGGFLEKEYKRKIVFEQLRINNKVIFTREEGLDVGSLTPIKNFLVNEFDKNKESAISLATSNLEDEELFLTNGFKTMFSTKLVSLIIGWLDNKFMVIYCADSMQLIRKFADPKKIGIC